MCVKGITEGVFYFILFLVSRSKKDQRRNEDPLRIDNFFISRAFYLIFCLMVLPLPPERCKRIEKKNLWDMKVTVMPIIIGALCIITKGLIQGLEDLDIKGRMDTIQTTALLRPDRILRRVLKTWADSSERSSANSGMKDSHNSNNNRARA